ncbi:MAG: glycerol kinase GlpK, partial [Atopobiaceae bacterium]|nr:glycerol kinase GlpK [Atopobiaceae bacterium]
WILENVEGACEMADNGELMCGTIDTWLIYNLTHGQVHATDYTNASRTMLYDIHNDCWDEWLCDLFGIPMSMLPQVRPSSGDFGNTSHPAVPKGIPICGVAGDQQAALFGQACFHPGEAKNTYGTGCFLLMNTGERAVESGNGLVTTIAASAPGCTHTEYALEGSVFVAGALIQWLRDGIGLISSTEEVEPLYNSVPDTGGVYVVPAFTGLGAPYWDADARGAIYGLTRGTTRAHIVRAALDSLAYQVDDLLEGMASDSDVSVRSLAVDGGASRNNALLCFQSALSGIDIIRPANTETTAMGASYLAGLACGFWESTSAIRAMRVVDATFSEPMSDADRARLLDGWHDCIARTRSHTR